MLPWVNPPPQTHENDCPDWCSSNTSGESNLPSQMIKGRNMYKFKPEYFSASPATLKLFENIKVTLTVASYKYVILLCLTFDPGGPCYYKYTIKFVKLKAGYQCLPSDIPACVRSINAQSSCSQVTTVEPPLPWNLLHLSTTHQHGLHPWGGDERVTSAE